jgi:glycerol uptake facilitator-like aquaporin
VVNTAPLAGRPADLAADPAKLLYIALCFGFSLAVNAWVFFRISGGLFNPAVSSFQVERDSMTKVFSQVSIGMMVVGAVPYLRGCLVILSQILGAIAASQSSPPCFQALSIFARVLVEAPQSCMASSSRCSLPRSSYLPSSCLLQKNIVAHSSPQSVSAFHSSLPNSSASTTQVVL